ncbi:hypothetical protein G6F52_014148 [Rhizopus delemar]|nr:hypothetical protein G6F52_014148 [Rhizopus delemar]
MKRLSGSTAASASHRRESANWHRHGRARACCADRSRSGSCGAASTHRGPASTRPPRCRAGRRSPAAARGYRPAAGPAGRC